MNLAAMHGEMCSFAAIPPAVAAHAAGLFP